MAVNVSYVYIFILCIQNFISNAAVERRFSDFKSCPDEECSMLLCRGKTFSDYTGPDCRFLPFKKGETIYVYYKLSSQRTNIWAGSVGNRFGYFNKDQLVINHIYTEKELEIPAEETDFVYFDTGHDKFDSYDIDSLLGSSLLLTDKEESVQVTTETFYLNKSAESTTVEVDEPPPEVTLLENYEIDRDVPEDIDKVVEVLDNDDLRHFEALEFSLPQPETLDTKGVEYNTVLETTAERIKDYLQKDQQRTEDSVPYSVVEPEEGEIKETPSEPLSKDDPELENAPGGFSEGRPMPELKTTLGITFDAVTSNDEDTWKVTPYDEERDKTEYQQDEESDYHLRETPLLAFSEVSSSLEHENILESDHTDEEDCLSEVPHTQKQDSKDNNLWSAFGDTVFNIVSGGERIAHVAGSEEDEEDDEGEITPEQPPKIEEPKESFGCSTSSELIFEQPADSNFSEDAVKVPDEDSQMLQFEDESEEADIEPSTPPADEASPFEHTEALAENLTVDDSPVPKQLSQTDILSDFDSKINELEQKQAVEELPIQKEESIDFSQVENTFKQGGTELFRLLREPYQKIPDPSKNTMVKESHLELPIEEDDSIHLEGEAIEEELLEDEHAVLSSSKTEHTDENDTESLSEFGSEQPNNYTQTDVVSSDVLDVVQHDEAIDIEPEVHETESDAESHTPSLKDKVLDPLPNKATEYNDNVLRLTLLRDQFKEEDMERLQKILGLQNLFRVEFLFSDLELKAARLSQTNTSENIEKVLEASETPILDEIERMLNAQENADLQQEAGEFVEEASIMDDFQELVFTLSQKYSTARNSAPLAVGSQLHPDTDGDMSDDAEEEKTFPQSVEDTDKDNLTVTETGEETKAPEKPAHDGHKIPDMGIEEDSGYLNRNKDNQASSKTPEEIQRGPQTILENTLDMGLSVDMDHPPSVSLESPVTDFHEEEQSGSSFVSVLILSGRLITLFYEYLGIYGVMMVTSLPEHWKPGPDFYSVFCEPVLVTAGAGVIGFLFWRSILSVKSKSYLTTEKELVDRMKMLEQEKEEILQKVAELQQRGKELKENQKLSEKSATLSLEKIQDLENIVQEMERQNERLDEENHLLAISFDKERANTAKHEDMMSEMDKTIEKLKRSKKKTQDALSKSTILMDEVKLREDAQNVQHQVLEKDIATLKEENLSLHHAAKLWEEKHKETREQIKVYHKSQKDLEDSLVQKDHNIEVLSDLLGDLEACDDLKGGVVANGEAFNDKQTIIQNRIKQMMVVSRNFPQVQTTLSVVEEERDRFMTKLLNEEKSRKELEEQFQKLEHDILLVKSDKNHLENQYKTLQQKNDIMTEMYQQKENALQQKLTKEEFERPNKEDWLMKVDSKALEEEVKVCRQRVKEIQDELKRTEKSYKAQIIEQEQKSHENWVIARAAERAMFDEKKENTNLRNLLTDMSSKLNELRRPLFKPTPGMAPMPLRRGPRPRGRYPPDHKHPVASRPDTMAPRTSSPSDLGSSTAPLESQAEAQASTENPEANTRPQGPGSLLVSPIRSPPDSSPGPLRPVISHPSRLCYRPIPGPHHILPPPPFMPPVYRPDNGHSGMMPPGPPPPNGHPPGPMIPPGHQPPTPGAYSPPSPHNRYLPPPSHYEPVPPPFGVSGSPPMGRPMGPPHTYVHYGPLHHSILPPGVAPYPHVGPRDFPVQPQVPHGHDSSVGPQPGAGPQGQGQDYRSQQATAAPQDSDISAMAEP
ncbi:transport and Golgi organization protein 1 homolog isoform X3 [Oncorhynchus kisutch]|uniref:transport and Golgi organization protein 1 homolog isoform X3 n=1 Tax=Oncorhynchus kisutch TaxID=8019 RepID=UPI0009A087C5|nr:transport and Golgi organization protein 1 homolog isoform X3 [Oncorhynchus kisutch]